MASRLLVLPNHSQAKTGGRSGCITLGMLRRLCPPLLTVWEREPQLCIDCHCTIDSTEALWQHPWHSVGWPYFGATATSQGNWRDPEQIKLIAKVVLQGGQYNSGTNWPLRMVLCTGSMSIFWERCSATAGSPRVFARVGAPRFARRRAWGPSGCG